MKIYAEKDYHKFRQPRYFGSKENNFGSKEKFFGSKDTFSGSEETLKKVINSASSSEHSDSERICSKEGVKKSVKYYLQNTTLHGLKYIAEDKITIPERVFFGLSFILVMVLSGFFISNVYTKWTASPIIITTSAKLTLATEVPFPAITICNLNQALKSKVETISKRSFNYSLLMSLCGEKGGDVGITYLGTWKYFKSILTEVAQPCDQMLLYCSFGSIDEDCSMIFNSVLTDDGLCCTFNALDPIYLLRNNSEENRFSSPSAGNNESYFVPIDWTPEMGYDIANLPEHYYPRASGGIGSRMGLTVILNASSSEYYCSKSRSIGFKVLVHNPAELPKISNYGSLITTGREGRIPIEPIYQNAVKSIRNIKKSVRRCLFSDEGDLMYYQTYSRKNCELECEAKILMKLCNCILYYLPRIDPTVRICGPNDNACSKDVQTKIDSSNNNITCAYCLPGCFELDYRMTISSSSINYGNFMSVADFPEEIFANASQIEDIDILHFYYTSNTFRSTTKSEVFGFTEFLSNTGGLLGLFMGFSIFSLIEIIFYVTVRPYCAARTAEAKRRKRHRQTSSSKKELKNPKKLRVIPAHWNKSIHKKTLRTISLEQQKAAWNDSQHFPYLE